MRHGEGATRAKIILHVDDEQRLFGIAHDTWMLH
jgi:hypothetical protein